MENIVIFSWLVLIIIGTFIDLKSATLYFEWRGKHPLAHAELTAVRKGYIFKILVLVVSVGDSRCILIVQISEFCLK